MLTLDIGCGAVQIWIESKGRPLEEHQVSSTSKTSQKCYVASKENDDFSIMVKSTRPSTQDLCLDIFLDGIFVRGEAFHKRTMFDASLDAAIVSDTEEKPFMFGKLQLVEDEDGALLNTSSLAQLGTIRIELFAIKRRVKSIFVPLETSLPGEAPVSEKSKKAGCHAVKLGKTRRREKMKTVEITQLVEYPLQEAVFHYAPLDFLMARDIVVRESQTPGASDRSSATKREFDDAELSDEDDDSVHLTPEERAVLAKAKSLKAARKRRRRE